MATNEDALEIMTGFLAEPRNSEPARFGANSKPLPSVSIIMPVFNESAIIDRSLLAVLTQDYPKDRVEVIVSDGLSSDGTREKILALAARYPNLRMIDNPPKIVATGLNSALRLATGDIIIRVDGHCEIASDYISRCVSHLQSRVAQGVGGPLDTIGETPLSKTIAVAMSSRFGVGGSAFRTRKGITMLADTVAFPAYTRAIVDKAGPFDEELVRNQDDEYNCRLRKLGAKILLAHDVRVRYYARSTLRSLWKQYFQYGYWKVRVMQKHPGQMKIRQLVPGVFVFTVLSGCILAPFSGCARWFLLAIALSYLLANFTASVTMALRRGWRYTATLPVVFGILHLSYGLGFLWGFTYFIFLRRPPLALGHERTGVGI